MKIAFCLFKYFPYGGLERDFLRYASMMKHKGHEIHIFTMKWTGDKDDTFHFHIINIKAFTNHQRCRLFAKRLKVIFETALFDLIIGFNKMPGLDLYYAADSCYQERLKEKSLIHRFLPRYRCWQQLEKAVFDKDKKTEILLISPLEQAKYEKHYQTAKSRFHLLSPVITKPNLEEYSFVRKRYRQQFQILEEDYVFLFVGSSFKTKGLDRAIKSIASLPSHLKEKIHFFVIGNDQSNPYLNLAKKLNVSQIYYLGARDDVFCFMQASDLFLHPAYHENAGLVILESLSCGLPVLTIDHCGYAAHVTASQAGFVLASPFVQSKWDALLANYLVILKSQRDILKDKAIQYTMSANLYGNNDNLWDNILTTLIANKQIQPTNQALLSYFMNQEGEKLRIQPGRSTQLIHHQGNKFILKKHFGVGFKEIFKNIILAKKPVIGAYQEWLALKQLESLNILAPIAYLYMEKGLFPQAKQSFILMECLNNTVSLETFTSDWKTNPPSFKLKRKLIRKIAEISKRLHHNGINHCDFYICHFLLDLETYPNQLKLYLIDLHRARIRKKVPTRWLLKDLAGLYFSSLHINLTLKDLLYFVKIYQNHPVGKSSQSIYFWQKVIKRGRALQQKHRSMH